MDIGSVDVELSRKYEQLETAQDDLAETSRNSVKLGMQAELALDKSLLTQGEGTVPEKQARARIATYEERLAAELAKAEERIAKSGLSVLDTQSRILQTFAANYRKV